MAAKAGQSLHARLFELILVTIMTGSWDATPMKERGGKSSNGVNREARARTLQGSDP
jgi:hypothetical protein